MSSEGIPCEIRMFRRFEAFLATSYRDIVCILCFDLPYTPIRDIIYCISGVIARFYGLLWPLVRGWDLVKSGNVTDTTVIRMFRRCGTCGAIVGGRVGTSMHLGLSGVVWSCLGPQ